MAREVLSTHVRKVEGAITGAHMSPHRLGGMPVPPRAEGGGKLQDLVVSASEPVRQPAVSDDLLASSDDFVLSSLAWEWRPRMGPALRQTLSISRALIHFFLSLFCPQSDHSSDPTQRSRSSTSLTSLSPVPLIWASYFSKEGGSSDLSRAILTSSQTVLAGEGGQFGQFATMGVDILGFTLFDTCS